MNISRRSYKKELLDQPDIPFVDIQQNMNELEIINTYLGGHQITLSGIRQLLNNRPDKNEKIVICEIGCGGGDNMIAINNWCKKNKIVASFIGIDINPYCIQVATEKLAGIDAELIASDYIQVMFDVEKPDYIFNSLFCHHFNDEGLKAMLKWMQLNAESGFFINDLHRNLLAFYSIRLLTKLFSRSYLVKNDAPLSVLRGFKEKEWKYLLKAAGIKNYSIQWKWAFRHLITVHTSTNILPALNDI